MSVYWKFFKVCLEKSNVNAAYIDDEGSEIPIESECEFEEAIKFAKKFGDDQLHLILKVKDTKNTEHILKGTDKSEIRFMRKSKDKVMLSNQVSQCQLENAAPPIWFTDYMKKFKHKLLEEIKYNMQETIKPVLSEIKKLKNKKDAESTGFQMQFSNQEKVYSTLGEDKNISQNEHQLFLQDFTRKNVQSNAKKLSVKDSSNISREQRDHKLMGNTELLKLQNLDSKYLNDEKKKKSEKKSHSKSKLENKNIDSNQTPYNNLKVGIHMKKKQTVVKPGENFTLLLYVYNWGMHPWEKPSVKCSAPDGFNIEKKIKLSRENLENLENVIVRGRAPKRVGVYKIHFELLERDFLMTTFDHAIIVTDPEPRETCNVKTGKSKEKSEEAVKEIEKKLDGISLKNSVSIRSNASSPSLGEKRSEEKGVDALCSLEKSFSKKDVKTNGKNAEVEFYTQSSPNSSPKGGKDTKIEKGTEAFSEKESEIVDLINLDSNSDSELSILCISEGEEEEEMNSENFVFLPLHPDEKDQVEVKTVKDQATEMNSPLLCEEEPIFSTNLKEPLISANSKSDGKILRKEKEIRKNKKFFSRSRSPLPDDRKSSRTKKLKSFKSTEYQFKAADLTRPALSIYAPYNNTNNNERTFTFTGEHQWEHKTPTSSSSAKENKVPTIDSLGRTIYAVSSRGYCLPVENLMQDDKEKSNGDNNNNNNNNNKSASVNILPDALMSGASNMASLAINTAKSVISNLQSALVKEGTEMGKPACEPKKVKLPSMESLYKLFEMGFTDLQFNRNLLLQHDNDLCKVVEELILLEQSRNRK